MVKNVFIKIYLADSNYLEKMHNNFIDQINSYIPIDNIIYENDDIFILIKKNNKDMKLKLPNLPKGFTNKEIVNKFIDGIKKSKYFIK